MVNERVEWSSQHTYFRIFFIKNKQTNKPTYIIYSMQSTYHNVNLHIRNSQKAKEFTGINFLNQTLAPTNLKVLTTKVSTATSWMTHKPTSPPYIKTLKLYYQTKPCEAKDIYVEEADWGQRIQYDGGANIRDKGVGFARCHARRVWVEQGYFKFVNSPFLIVKKVHMSFLGIPNV